MVDRFFSQGNVPPNFSTILPGYFLSETGYIITSGYGITDAQEAFKVLDMENLSCFKPIIMPFINSHNLPITCPVEGPQDGLYRGHGVQGDAGRGENITPPKPLSRTPRSQSPEL